MTARRGPARPVIVATFLTMLTLSIPNALGAAVPSISAASGVDVALVGQLATVNGLGGAVGLVLWTVVGRRRPTRQVLVGAVAVLLLAVVAIALNPVSARVPSTPTAFAVLVGTVVVVGTAFGVGITATNTVLANRGASAGLLNAANGMFGLGAVGLPLLVGLADLRASAIVVAVLAAITLPLLRRVPDVSPELRDSRDQSAAARSARRRASDEEDGATLRQLAGRAWHGGGSRPWVWAFGVAIGVEVGTAAWAATHLVSIGVSEQRAAAAVAGFFAVFTAARFGMAALGDRIPVRWTVIGCNLWAAAAAIATVVVPWPAVAWALVGLGVGPVYATLLSWLTAATGDADGARRMNVGGAVGGIALPFAIGLLVDAFDPGMVPWAVAAYAAVTAGLAATLPAADDQRPAAAGAATSAPT